MYFIFSFFYLFLCECTTKATLWAQWKSKFACCANTLSELGIFREEPVLNWPKPWQILQQSNTEVTRERPWEVSQMRVQKRPQQRESRAQWWVLSDGRWQPEIRNMTAPRKSAYAEWTPSLEISEDLYGRGGRDTFASQTHHRERCPHHLHQQSVGISNQLVSAIWMSSWHQQLESAVYISRPQKQVTRPRDGMIAWTWTTYCKWSRVTQVKDWALQCIILIIFISNQLTSASTSAANCDCSQCTYRQQASHPDR